MGDETVEVQELDDDQDGGAEAEGEGEVYPDEVEEAEGEEGGDAAAGDEDDFGGGGEQAEAQPTFTIRRTIRNDGPTEAEADAGGDAGVAQKRLPLSQRIKFPARPPVVEEVE